MKSLFRRGLGLFLAFLSLAGAARVDAAPPLVTTLAASGLSNSVATLNGSVNPGGETAAVWFEWGGSPFTNSNVTLPVITNSAAALTLSVPLAGLTPGLIYYSRLVASNATGFARGEAVPFGSPALALVGDAVVTNGDFAAYLTSGARATFAPRGLGAGYNYAVALKGDTTAAFWMPALYSSSYHGFAPGVSNLVAVSGNVNYALGLVADGLVVAEPSSIFTNIPASLSNVVAIAAGGTFGLALRSNHTVVGWGAVNPVYYTPPPNLTNAIAIAAGSDFSLALRDNGTVAAWGSSSFNQTNVPPGLSNVVAIAAGGEHSLALKRDGTVVAWGGNFAGETLVPAGLSNVVALAAGLVQSVALKSDGTVVTWGDPFIGASTASLPPTNVVAIASSDYNNLALLQDGTIFVWSSSASKSLTNVPPSVYAFPWYVSGSLNTNIPGTYVLTYSAATNSFGGVATPVTRTVVVVAPPTLDQVSPASGPTAGGITLTLTGSDFGTSGTVFVGGQAATILTNGWSPTQIQCTLPPGQGANQPVIVVSTGRPSAAKTFSYDPPQLTNISPTNGPTAGGIPIMLSGLDFGGGGYVNLGGTVITNITAWTNNTITFTLPAGLGGNLPVTVNVAGQTNIAGPKFSYYAPAISSLTPSNGPTAGGIPITLVGTDFGPLGSGFVTFGTAGQTLFVNTWSATNIQCLLPPGQGYNLPVAVVVGGQASAAKPFSYLPPQIFGVTPPHGPTAGLTNITLTGTNFGSGGTVTIGGVAATNYSAWSHGQITFTLPPGQGSNLPVVVAVSNQFSQPASFSYDAPRITGASPTTGPTAGGTVITLTGSDFGVAPYVTIGGSFAFLKTNTHSQIQCVLPAGQGTNLAIIVWAAEQQSPPWRFDYAPPALQGITPTNGPTAGGPLITLMGTNFGSSGSVTVGAFTVTNFWVWADFQIAFYLPPGEGSNLPVVVSIAGQPAPPARFSYLAPFLQNVSPGHGPAAGGTLVTLAGLNFGLSPQVYIGGQLAQIITNSHSQIVCQVPPGSGTNQSVIVHAAGQPSNPQPFSYDRPSIRGISPTNGPTAGGTLITITGTNFGGSGSVLIGGAAVNFADPAATWGDGLIRCLTPPGTGAPADVVVVSGGQPAEAGSFYYLRPALTMDFQDGIMKLLWPSNATDYVLEKSSPLGSNWGPFIHLEVVEGTNVTSRFLPNDTNAWYRLRRP